jgi:hypothetical protein
LLSLALSFSPCQATSSVAAFYAQTTYSKLLRS